MAQAMLDFQGIGRADFKINDAIECFKTVYQGENIEIGDFVNFINKEEYSFAKKVGDTQISDIVNSAYEMSATLLDSTRVFLLHSGVLGDENWVLHGVIVTINNNSITKGIAVRLGETKISGSDMTVVRLSSTKVYISYCEDYDKRYLYGVVCSVSGTTITKGTPLQLSTTANSGRTSICIGAGSSTVYVFDYATMGYVVSISGTTLTKTLSTSLGQSSSHYAITRLSGSKLFLAYSLYSSTYSWHACGMIVNCSSSAITFTNYGRLSSTVATAYDMSLETISTNSVILFHCGVADSYYLYGQVCTISNDAITPQTDTQLSTASRTGLGLSTEIFDKNFVITGEDDANGTIYIRYCAVNNNIPSIIYSGALVPATETHGTYTESLRTANGDLLVFHDGLYLTDNYMKVRAQLFEIFFEKEYAIKATSNVIEGLSKMKGTGGNEITVYAPKFYYKKYNKVVNGDFVNGLTNWTKSTGTLAVSSGILSTTLSSTLTGTGSSSLGYSSEIYNSYIGHIYYYRGEMKVPNGVTAQLYYAQTATGPSEADKWMVVSNRISVTSDIINPENNRIRLIAQVGNSGDVVYWDNIRLYDLTEMFGVGNEPTKEWCDANL